MVVLDLNMPKIAGSALLGLWKDDPTPVVVLSSSTNPKEREFCLASGAREFVSKPVELEEFQGAVARIIEHWGSRVVSVGVRRLRASGPRSGTGHSGCRSVQLHPRERRSIRVA